MVGAIVSVSMGAMNTLLPKLTALIDGEYKHLKSVKGGITFLRDELSSMSALLVTLANNEERLDEQSKEWRNKVRELSYDFEDCIDLFIHKLKRGDANANVVKRTARKIKKLWSRHKIANLIQELKDRVEEVNDRHLRYKVEESVANMVSTVQIDPRLPALYVEADKLVGIDGPREEIIEWLMEDDSTKGLKVVSIVGFGGLGKTTLAKQVQNKIKGQFTCTAFVPVSRSPNITKILTDILKEFGVRADSSDDARQLIEKLRAYLQDKRYLIVVDDIWSTDAWEIVKSAFPENSLCSRIITTTRHADVAKSCCSSFEGYIHNIQPLNDQDSKKLFYKRIFPRKCSCPPHLKDVSEAIIKKCHGLPLAIITIASLLANKGTDVKDQWEEVRSSMVSELNAQNVGSILLLSYYDLPPHLKTCLLYLSVFPEDYSIPREELIWMWIAEGFITETRRHSLEEIGEKYFNDLVNRSLIQPVDLMYDGRAEACQVHDMVLDLIITLSTEENFATIVEGQVHKCFPSKIRRLSLLSECVGNEAMQEIMEKWSHIRSLISFHGLGQQTQYCLPKLDNLRVLVSGYSSFDPPLKIQQIKNVGSFFQLKYLRIRSCHIELPNEIGDLQNLQTLDINTIDKLPPTIGRLRNLVRLLVNDGDISLVHFPEEIGNLQALQVLSSVTAESVNFLRQLGRLTSLRVLGMQLRGSTDVGVHDKGRVQEALESSLIQLGKHGLKSLEIRRLPGQEGQKLLDSFCCHAPCLKKLELWCYFGSMPQRLASLISLSHLQIDVRQINQEDLSMLGGIPTLLYLEMQSHILLGERLIIGSQEFQCLKEFNFWASWNGLRFVCEREAMPNLRSLHLRFGAEDTEPKMGFEFSFEHLASLEHLSVTIECYKATRSRVEAAEAAIKNATNIHPGRPTLQIRRDSEETIVEDEDARGMLQRDGMTDSEEIQQEHS
ncbi:hypothetical protein ACP70R_022815 [Stipagrostis hirtigluma subsp. patula]